MDTNKAQTELDKLKQNVVGIFKNRYNGVYELITNANEETIDTIYITSFGAIQECYGQPHHYGQVELFSDNKNMMDMLDDPFAFSEFMERFKKL